MGIIHSVSLKRERKIQELVASYNDINNQIAHRFDGINEKEIVKMAQAKVDFLFLVLELPDLIVKIEKKIKRTNLEVTRQEMTIGNGPYAGEKYNILTVTKTN